MDGQSPKIWPNCPEGQSSKDPDIDISSVSGILPMFEPNVDLSKEEVRNISVNQCYAYMHLFSVHLLI